MFVLLYCLNGFHVPVFVLLSLISSGVPYDRFTVVK